MVKFYNIWQYNNIFSLYLFPLYQATYLSLISCYQAIIFTKNCIILLHTYNISYDYY